MKRRLAQISLALLAVATLSACIIIQSDGAQDFTPASEPSAASTPGR